MTLGIAFSDLDRSASARLPAIRVRGRMAARLDRDHARSLRAPHVRTARGGSAQARPAGVRAWTGSRREVRRRGEAAKLTRRSGCKTGAVNQKGLAAKTANPSSLRWLRGSDLNRRPLGYEPNELPGCSTPR